MQRTFWFGLLAVLLPLGIAAQETRGNISGTVRDAQGVVPGAMVAVTNVDTQVTQNLATNDSGYFEAPLLNPGNYSVTVQMTGFRSATRTNIVLGVGQQLTVPFVLEVGAITEEVLVRAETPLLDTTSLSSGANFDSRLVDSLPMFSNMPITLSRFSPGLNVNDAQTQVSQGYVDNTSLSAGSLLGLPLAGTQNPLTPPVGGNNYTLDGANNNGSNRRIAASPNSDMIQEMRIESANFDASVGHGLGLQISMMTRAGTNTQRGTVNYQYWSNRLNSLTEQQKITFDDRAKSEFEKGRSHNLSLTAGGPVRIPGIVDGRGKLFYFANYSLANDAIPGKIQGSLTVPANERHLQGDFSDLLRLPNPAQYQIYDPLTTRPDPTNPGRMIRDPFPNNIIPRDRIFNPDGTYKNPLMNLYSRMIPRPNQNFLENGQQPLNNFYRGGEPDSPKSQQYGFRLDFNASSRDRFFFRTSGITFLEYVSDWTYLAEPELRIHSADRSRYQWSYTGTWTRAMGNTVLDSSVATNRFNQIDDFRGLKKYKPTDVGLPAYLDEFCTSKGGCTLPAITIGNFPNTYQGFGGGLSDGDTATHLQAQSAITSVKGRHTLHGGVDVRRAQRDRTGGGNRSGQLTFDRTYTRQFSDESTLTPSNLGLALAAFELGLPTSASINDTLPSSFDNYWMGSFAQDTWRLGRLTVNAGLRFEYETGVREKDGHMIVGFDETAKLAITDAARAAYLASGLQNQPGMPATLTVLGGPIYANAAGQSGAAYKGKAMWMPRASASYQIGDRTVLKGGYGLYYDTLNASDYVAAQAGYSVTTTSTISDDLGRTFKWATPATGAGSFDPFPVRADGTRWDPVVGDALGVNTLLGGSLTTENGMRDHARQQRWRLSVQRQLSGNVGVEVAYAGAYNDRLPVTIREDYLPEQYWDGSNTRNTAANTYLTAQVPNPYFINNFAFLRTTDPVLYQRLASNPTFSSATIARNRLLRPFGFMTGGAGGLLYSNLPLGASKSHSLEVQVNRRFNNGLTGFMSFTANRVRFNRTVEEYDREPTLWQGSNDARPWRVAGVASYELPFGSGRRFLENGGLLAALASNWQVSGTWEFQPGALLDWGAQNIFFNGDLDDIALDDPTRDEWFNTDAGFERDPARVPAAFQKRTFPFRIDGVRGQKLTFTNLSIQRNFRAGGGRTWQLRMDAQNVFNRQQWQGATLNPTSTQFGQVTTVAANQMRFFTFGARMTF
jgi:Carboxypeptidase regulatory-like domain